MKPKERNKRGKKFIIIILRVQNANGMEWVKKVPCTKIAAVQFYFLHFFSRFGQIIFLKIEMGECGFFCTLRMVILLEVRSSTKSILPIKDWYLVEWTISNTIIIPYYRCQIRFFFHHHHLSIRMQFFCSFCWKFNWWLTLQLR